MKNNKVDEIKSDTVPAVFDDSALVASPLLNQSAVPVPLGDDPSIAQLVDMIDALEDKGSEQNGEGSDLTIAIIEDLEPAAAGEAQGDGSSLPLVNIDYGRAGDVGSQARDIAFNLVPPTAIPEVKLTTPISAEKHSPPIANPYDGEIRELFLDAREFVQNQIMFLAHGNSHLPYPDGSGEKVASPEGAIYCKDPIAIYDNYIEGYTSPGAGASSVQIVSMTFDNHVYLPDALGKIIISTADGQLVMYTSSAGLNQDFPCQDLTPGFFYYVQYTNENHAPGEGMNLFDHDMLITIQNNFGLTATGFFNVHIVDDVPIAHDDTVKLLQDLGLVDSGDRMAARDAQPGLPVNQVSGNLLANDDWSVDGKNLVNQVTYTYNGVSQVLQVVGSVSFDTDFGHVTIDANGYYTYSITAELPNDHVTEDRIQYQIIDKDGDISSADLLMRMAPAPVITIVPNDGELGSGDLTVTEGSDTSVQYKVVVTGVLLEDLSFNVSTQDNTAYADGNTPGRPDYTASSTVVTIPADEENSVHEVPLPPNTIVDDNVFENLPETFDTNVVPTQGTINSSSDTTIVTTILDDDPPPQINIQSQLTVTEGDPGGPAHYATLTITMTGSSQDPVTFHYQTQNGTALGGASSGAGNPDFIPISGDITFPPSFNGTQTFTVQVPIIDDYTYERLVNQQETFSLNLTPVNLNGAQFTNSSTVITIIDDDPAPYVKIIGGSISEAGGVFNAQVQFFGSSAEALTFNYTTSNGTAVALGAGAGQPDYNAVSGSFTFNPLPASGENALSQIYTIAIPIVNDLTYEGTVPENFTITLTPQGYVAGPPPSFDLGASTLSATVSIVDNDAAPTLVVGNIGSNGIINIAENDPAGGILIPITRVGGSTEAISFKLSTADITAIAGADYAALNPNTIYTIPASNGNATINVFIPIVNDGIQEGNDQFSVNITPVAGSLSGITNGLVTIFNDDIASQANNDSQTVDPSTFAAYNVTFILDTSGSMGFPIVPPDGPVNRLDVLKAALIDAGNLLDTYFALSNGLHINIIEFNTNANFVSETNVNNNPIKLQDVKNDIDNLNEGGGTNYGEALDKAINRFIADNGDYPGYINRSYFISDGEPSDALTLDFSAWQAALLQYGVHSYTANISAGETGNTYLDQIASPGQSTFTAAADLSNLDDFLLSTIAISGNVLANDAPSNSGPASVISYTYDNGTQIGTIGVSVTTALGGKFVMYADGSYNYIPDGNNAVPETEVFNYTIQDPGGNVSSANLNLNMLAFLPPVVLDLNHDGNIDLISVANSNVSFDVNHDGTKEHVGWVSPNDGILVYDPTDSGQVTDVSQISFASYVSGAKTDLQGLTAFDSNHDGKLDAGDDAYSHFGVWQDSNSNGVVDSGEYSVLSKAGIVSLSLSSDNNRESVSGNVITGSTSYQTSDGQSHLAADVSLSVGTSIANQAANAPLNSNDVLPGANAIDFSSLPESNSPTAAAATLPALANDPASAAAPAAASVAQEDASVTAALQQTQQETAALHPA